MRACKNRYPQLEGILETIHADLMKNTRSLPYADLIIANLFIEYIGYSCFQQVVKQVDPQVVSCVIQLNTDVSFASDSPYIHTFDRLDEVHHQMDETKLISAMNEIGYKKADHKERNLPNGKKLVRIDFIVNWQ